ncbi:hypothetical protein ACA910_021069 [Epithemia clementina (nom. ined.)]
MRRKIAVAVAVIRILFCLLLPDRRVSSWLTNVNFMRQARPVRSSFVGVSVLPDDEWRSTPPSSSSMTPKPTTTTTTSPPPPPPLVDAAKEIYSMPALYDLAFGFRDYQEEVEFLLQTHRQITGFPARRILDIGAGPARHGIAALMQKQEQQVSQEEPTLSVTCIDSSSEMASYAQQLALDELSDDQRSNFHYVVDDFRTFDLSNDDEEEEENEFDTAWILLGSLQHLTQNKEVVQCLSCIYKCLRPQGTVIIELPHPRETFTMVDCTRNDWTVPLEDGNGEESGELQIIWGDDDDFFDPITQVRQLTIDMQLAYSSSPELADAAAAPVNSSKNKMQNVRGVVPTRLFTAQEMDALALLANFQVVAMYGALDEGVSVDDDAAFRLVCVLQKEPKPQ